ncbi:hypothetical protein [Nonomuraea sp. JJY05]|uniref:hypothetical protein n=1 Tax=Nonomuraea sp. JJY05 TaxID=3350255 RepID=UPI00373F6732
MLSAERDQQASLTDWLARTRWLLVERGTNRTPPEQALAYAMPAAPDKAVDPRWPSFAARHGRDLAELRHLIEATIAHWIDPQAWRRSVDDDQRDIHRLRQFMGAGRTRSDTAGGEAP